MYVNVLTKWLIRASSSEIALFVHLFGNCTGNTKTKSESSLYMIMDTLWHAFWVCFCFGFHGNWIENE